MYFYGETGESKNGIDYLKNQVEDITGQKIDYWMMVDYNHFVTLIDILGSVKVYVEKEFQDDYFPLISARKDLASGILLHLGDI